MPEHRRFAEGTDVPIDRTKTHIEAELIRYGADQYALGVEPGRAVVAFRIEGWHVRMHLPLEVPPDDPALFTPTGQRRTGATLARAVTNEQRRRWRALYLIIKAKLEASTSGIVTVGDEFAPYIVLPDGSTVAEWLYPQLQEAYESGTMPSALPSLPSGPRALGPGR